MTDRLDEIQARVSTLHYAIDEGHPFTAASFASTVCGEDVPFLLAEVTRLRAIIEEAMGLLTPTAFELDNGYTSKKALFAGQIMDILAKATPEGGTK